MESYPQSDSKSTPLLIENEHLQPQNSAVLRHPLCEAYPSPFVKAYLLGMLNEKQREIYDRAGGLEFADPPSPDLQSMPLYETKSGGYYFGQVQPGTGTPHGQGISWDEKHFYEGYWQNGLANGDGVDIYEDGTTCVGNFKDGPLSGQGIKICPDGQCHVGSFKKNELYGQGEVFSAYGIVYEGRFLQGLRDGWGKYTFANGNIDQGEFLDGELHGYARRDQDTKSYYIKGHMKFDQRNGKVVFETPKVVITGVDMQSKGTGLSLVYWKEPGKTDICSLKQGKRHGIVYTKTADGAITKALYQNDVFVKELKF